MITSSRVGLPGLFRSTGRSSCFSDFCWFSSMPCFHLLTASYCRLCKVFDLDCYLKLTVLFRSLMLTHFFSCTFLPSSFRSRGRSRALAFCVGFAPKQTKGSSDWHPNIHTTNAQHRVTIFWVFGMTRPGIEPRSPGLLANTLTIMPMSGKPTIKPTKFCQLLNIKNNLCSRHFKSTNSLTSFTAEKNFNI